MPQDGRPTGSLGERVKTIRDNLNDAGLEQSEITPMERALTNAVHDILDALDQHAKDLKGGIDPGMA